MPYGFKRSITIDHTKVPNTNQTNFPVLIFGTYSYLAVTGSGGNIQNTVSFSGQTVPADLLFTSDSAGTTPLSFEIASYVSTTGAIEIWIKIPSVLTASDTIIYMFYGDATVTTYQGGSAGAAWDSSYLAVYHLANGTSLSSIDSTAGGFGTATPTAVTAATGQINGCGSFNGSTSMMNLGNASVSLSTATLEIWIKQPTLVAAEQAILEKGYNSAVTRVNLRMSIGTGGSGKLLFASFDSGSGGFSGITTSTGTIIANTLTHIIGTYDGTTYRLYINGVLDTSVVGTIFSEVGASWGLGVDLSIGPGSIELFNGSLDEGRISNTARSADYAATCFNNQFSPSTFYAISSVITSGGIFAPANVLDGMGSIRVNRLA